MLTLDYLKLHETKPKLARYCYYQQPIVDRLLKAGQVAADDPEEWIAGLLETAELLD